MKRYKYAMFLALILLACTIFAQPIQPIFMFFTDLIDTPADYTGDGGKIVVVNSTPDALEFTDSPTVTNLTATGYLDMAEIAEPAAPSANSVRLYAEDIQGFSFLKYLDSGGMKRELMRDSMLLAYNNSGSTIAAARIVYADAATATVPEIKLAKADSISTMPAIGVTIESIANGAYGRVMQIGILENVNTSALSAGDVLYVSAATAGIPVTTAPATPNLNQEIGTVLVDHASTGAIQIVARGLTGDEYGTAQNSFLIGDGASSSKTLTFNAVTDGSIIWDETKFDFGSNPIETSGGFTGALTGNADTATALAANGSNAASGNAILGVDASGAAEGAFDVWTEAENTAAGYISATLTEEEVEDFVGGMVTGGTETHIAVTYTDGGVGAGVLNFVVDPDSVAGSISAGAYNDNTVGVADLIHEDFGEVTYASGSAVVEDSLSVDSWTFTTELTATDLIDVEDMKHEDHGEVTYASGTAVIEDSITVGSWTLDSPTITTGLTATDLIDSAHYNADSIDNEHINWADIDNLGDEGAITVADTTDTTSYVALWESATGDLAAKSDAGITYNAGTGTLNSTVITEGGVAVYNDNEIDAFSEIDAIVADKSLVNLEDGGTFTGNIIANANLSVGNAATTAGVLTLLEDDDDGANFASFMVPALAANTVYTLPPDDGDAGEQLQTDGAGVTTWEAAGGAGATAWDDIGDPDNSGLTTITFDNAETSLLTGDNDATASFVTIQNTDADHTVGALYLLDLDYSADDGDAQASYIKCQDSGGTVLTIDSGGDFTTTGRLYIPQYIYHSGNTNTYLEYGTDTISLVAGAESMISIVEAAQDYVEIGDDGDIDIKLSAGADGALTVEGSSGNTILAANLIIPDAGTIGSASDTGILTLAADGSATFQPTADNTTFFQVLDADGGTSVLNVDSTSERVGIGNDSPAYPLDVAGVARVYDRLYLTGSDADYPTFYSSSHSDTAWHGGFFYFQRSRNTAADPCSIVTGDNIFRIVTRCWDGDEYIIGGELYGSVDGTVANNVIPTEFYFRTMNDAGSLDRRLTIERSGSLVTGNIGYDGLGSAGVVVIYNGTHPTTQAYNACSLFAEDVSSASELSVIDEGENETVLSPHAFTLFEPNDTYIYPWSYHSKNHLIGKKINVDMYGAIEAIEQLSGKKFIYTEDIPKSELTWDEKQAHNQELMQLDEEVEITIEEAFELSEITEEVVVGYKTKYKFEGDKIVSYQEPITEQVPTGEFSKRLKPNVRLDEDTGRIYRKKRPDEVVIDPTKFTKAPNWLKKRMKARVIE